MKRGWAWLWVVVLLLNCAALAKARERGYAPEAGGGWLAVEIHGEAAELFYTGSVKGMTGTAHSFGGDGYTITLGFDKKLIAGEAMGENSITQIEVVSHNEATAGYLRAASVQTAGTVDSTTGAALNLTASTRSTTDSIDEALESFSMAS